jgi:hypothetical protein
VNRFFFEQVSFWNRYFPKRIRNLICFIFVQTALSAVFKGDARARARVFHKLFNTAVEIAGRDAMAVF